MHAHRWVLHVCSVHGSDEAPCCHCQMVNVCLRGNTKWTDGVDIDDDNLHCPVDTKTALRPCYTESSC